MNARKTPVIPLLTGTIIRWKKKDGVVVFRGETLCVIKPDISIDAEHEVPSPAEGGLTIIKPYNKPGLWVRGGITVIGEIQELLADIVV